MDEPRPSYLSQTDPEHDRRRRRIALVVVLVVLAVSVIGIGVANSSYQRCKEPPAADGRTVTFEVPEGASGKDVIAALADQGLIRCGGFIGDMLLRTAGNANGILAGHVPDPRGRVPRTRSSRSCTTPPAQVPTRPAHRPRRPARSARRTRGSGASRARSSSRPACRRRRSPRSPRTRSSRCRRTCLRATAPKGFLFPDTYEFVKKGIDAQKIVTEMLGQFDTEATKLDLVGGAKKLGYTPYQVVTIASMIEREAQVDKDRP